MLRCTERLYTSWYTTNAAAVTMPPSAATRVALQVELTTSTSARTTIAPGRYGQPGVANAYGGSFLRSHTTVSAFIP